MRHLIKAAIERAQAALQCPKCAQLETAYQTVNEALSRQLAENKRLTERVDFLQDNLQQQTDWAIRYRQKWDDALHLSKTRAHHTAALEQQIAKLQELAGEALARRGRGEPWGMVDALLRAMVKGD